MHNGIQIVAHKVDILLRLFTAQPQLQSHFSRFVSVAGITGEDVLGMIQVVFAFRIGLPCIVCHIKVRMVGATCIVPQNIL